MAWLYSSTTTYSDYTFMNNNANQLYSYLSARGWSLNAIAGTLGNLQKESGLNPWSSGSGGYGLAGWTPTWRYKLWCSNHGYDYSLGETQEILLASGEAHGWGGSHWGKSTDPNAPSVNPPITWEEYKVSDLSPTTLATYFMYYYEKPSHDPSVSRLDQRTTYANYWYEVLSGSPPPTPPTPPDPPQPPKPLPSDIPIRLLCYLKRRNRRR